MSWEFVVCFEIIAAMSHESDRAHSVIHSIVGPSNSQPIGAGLGPQRPLCHREALPCQGEPIPNHPKLQFAYSASKRAFQPDTPLKAIQVPFLHGGKSAQMIRRLPTRHSPASPKRHDNSRSSTIVSYSVT